MRPIHIHDHSLLYLLFPLLAYNVLFCAIWCFTPWTPYYSTYLWPLLSFIFFPSIHLCFQPCGFSLALGVGSLWGGSRHVGRVRLPSGHTLSISCLSRERVILDMQHSWTPTHLQPQLTADHTRMADSPWELPTGALLKFISTKLWA